MERLRSPRPVYSGMNWVDMADHDPTEKQKTALIRYRSDGRQIAKRSEPRVRIELGRIPEMSRELLDNAVSPAMQERIARASKRSARICAGTLAITLAIFMVVAGGFYLRLMQGPISFQSIAPTIEEKLNAELSGYRFRVSNAILRLNDQWGLEFRLQDVSLLDTDAQEIAKAPFAALSLSFSALANLKIAPSGLDLIGPKVLMFDTPEQGFTFSFTNAPTAPSRSDSAPAAGKGDAASTIRQDWRPTQDGAEKPLPPALPVADSETISSRLNFVGVLERLFEALRARDGASSYLTHFGIQKAEIYYVKDGEVTEWRVSDFHLELDENNKRSSIKGELTLDYGSTPWSMSFRIINRTQARAYTISANVRDVVPREIWRRFSEIAALKSLDMPVSASIRIDLEKSGEIDVAEGELQLGKGLLYAPWDEKHPGLIDQGRLRVRYDRDAGTVEISPFELAWGQSRILLAGNARREAPQGGPAVWIYDINAQDFTIESYEEGGAPLSLDEFALRGSYAVASDKVTLESLTLRGGDANIRIGGEVAGVTTAPAVRLTGDVSPMSVSFLRTIWPTFVAHGTRDWVGTNISAGRISGGNLAINLPNDVLKQMKAGGDIPDKAVFFELRLSGLVIHHLKGLPPIHTTETTARVIGRRFIFDAPDPSRIILPSGKSATLHGGQFIVGDLRPRFPNGEIHFRGEGAVDAALELLDHQPLGYVQAVGMKTDILAGHMDASFSIGLPLLKDVKFKQLSLSGKARVSDMSSNGLPGGFTVKGGEVNFDVTEKAIEASGEIRLNGVPVSLAWQRIFDAPPERQPRLRVAGVLSAKARDELGLKVNHILKGDLPVALAVETRKGLPPLLSAEANLSNAELFLTSIGWRKPLGQRASLTFDVVPGEGGLVTLENFTMTGDGLSIVGEMRLNEKRRLAGFSFNQFSPNALTQLSIIGDLTPQNVLKVQARGPSFDGRQFFRSLFSAGKLSEDQPEPPSEEPGLDLRVEIDTVFGHFDSTVKSVTIEAKRRAGKLSYLDVSGRLNGSAPVAVRVEQKQGEPRYLLAEATDAGTAFRLVGFYPAIQGGQTSLRVNLDGSGPAEKTGRLFVQNFLITGDQVVGQVLSSVEQERARSGRGASSQRRSARNRAAPSGNVLQFDRMTVPFSVGHGQFVLHDSAINGPVIGATLRGRIDFGRNAINLSGTYVPLYGLNAVLGEVPILGDIFVSRRGEGLLGITFAVQGPMANPNVLVNPVSMVAPGFLRQIFEFDPTPPQVIPRDGTGSAPARQGQSQPSQTRTGARAGTEQQPVR